MSPIPLLTPARRDALLAVLALVLLVAPIWAPMLHLGDPADRYERALVTAENGTIEYANESKLRTDIPISTEIVCTEPFMRSRGCFFEYYLAEGHTISTGIWSSNPDYAPLPSFERYRYAAVNGSVYEIARDVNESVQNDEGLYRVELALDPEPADEVLRSVSVSAERVPSPVRRAAERGTATSHREIEVPETPVRLADGTYYRVYEAGKTDPSNLAGLLDGIVRYSFPFLGLALVGYLRSRFEVRYVGES
ncbi:hypothetical protein [Halorussus lipolyticus]|uniref:hypothetical protein n=1 Tax=Halorussus lipolyticus TaxID=3034024 RepID=UPI0023E82FC7|nr:hypothetical protein [Halorussus sp. DT80]